MWFQSNLANLNSRRKVCINVCCRSRLQRQQLAVSCCVSCRKVKYLNMRGSLVDEHTVKGLTKAGKEVCCFHPLTNTLCPFVASVAIAIR